MGAGGCRLPILLNFANLLFSSLPLPPAGPLAEPAPLLKNIHTCIAGGGHACQNGAGGSAAVVQCRGNKRAGRQKVDWIALYDYRQLSGGKNLQKLLNIFFWGCYGLFRGRDELFRALPSPLRYHKRVFFASFVRVQKLKVFAGWTGGTSRTSTFHTAK